MTKSLFKKIAKTPRYVASTTDHFDIDRATWLMEDAHSPTNETVRGLLHRLHPELPANFKVKSIGLHPKGVELMYRVTVQYETELWEKS